MTDDDDGHWWETFYTPEQWAQVPAARQMWYNPDSTEETEERQQTEIKEAIQLIASAKRWYDPTVLQETVN